MLAYLRAPSSIADWITSIAAGKDTHSSSLMGLLFPVIGDFIDPVPTINHLQCRWSRALTQPWGDDSTAS